jgi:transcriptional regulator with XRE-family HTH domain
MKKKPQLIALLNFFAETLRETLEESSLSQAEIARRCGISARHLTQMKQGKRRRTREYDLRLA